MKRFRRVMLNALTILSLVLSLVLAESWALSYSRFDSITIVDGNVRTLHGVAATKGRLTFEIIHGNLFWLNRDLEPGLRYDKYVARALPPVAHTFLGFGWNRQVNPNWWTSLSTVVVIPHAYLVALFTIVPAIRSYRSFRRPRLDTPGDGR